MDEKHKKYSLNQPLWKTKRTEKDVNSKVEKYFDEWWNEQNEGNDVVHKRGDCCDSQDAERLRGKSTKPVFRQPTSNTNSNHRSDNTLTSYDFFVLDLYETQDMLANLLLRKHEDYGSTNISKAPGGPLNGLRVRLHDKIARLNNIIENNKKPEYESVKDTLIDIANYATIAIMVIDGTWDD